MTSTIYNQKIQETGGEELEAKRMRKAAPSVDLVRDGGKSLLPFSRVQKIIKADKDLPMVAKEAAFVISLAAEEFIKRLASASQMIANRENRATVQQRDIATVVRKADEFLFLEEIIPWITASPPTRRKSKGLEALLKPATAQPTLLDEYVVKGST
jgi:histone H3/H4